MKAEVNAPNCGRENDLIAFLYGELNDVEARTFQRHVDDCVDCSAELAAFRNVRESVVAWRNESLGGVVAPSRSAESPITIMDEAKPSALAALREFFNLSPLWLKGAVAFASILFCLFAGLSIARLGNKPAVVANNQDKENSEKQLNELVEQRVKAELVRIRNSEAQAPLGPVIVKSPGETPERPVKRGGTEVAGNAKARRPLSKTEREQLAADLRLTSAKNDTELDLLGDRINQ